MAEMDSQIHKLNEQIEDLQKKQAGVTGKLAKMGIDMDRDLDDDVAKLVHDCAELQAVTGVFSLDQNYLDEFYLGKEYESIEFDYTKTLLDQEMEEIESEIRADKVEISKLEKFLDSARERTMTESQKDKQVAEFELKNKRLLEVQKTFDKPQDIDLDELARKVQVLMSLKEKETKKAKPSADKPSTSQRILEEQKKVMKVENDLKTELLPDLKETFIKSKDSYVDAYNRRVETMMSFKEKDIKKETMMSFKEKDIKKENQSIESLRFSDNEPSSPTN